MYLSNIAISNYHTFTYHPTLELTKGMEFDTDPYTSNVNIIVGPNGSGKSNFLDLLTILCDIHEETQDTTTPTKSIKKHPGFESYPTTVVAQRVIGSASGEHTIIYEYNLDEMTYQKLTNGSTSDTKFNYFYYSNDQFGNQIHRHPDTLGLLQQYFGLSYDSTDQIFLTNSGSLLQWDDLGSGQQSICWMINQILIQSGSGGIILIDEPELHLHPQYQKQLGLIFEYLSRTRNTQIIIATHSPFFINADNIENVFRFTIHEGHTHMINPVDFRGQEGAKLRQILTDSHLAKLFFADCIIMVEGDTDEYFMSRYIQEYFKLHHLVARKYNYEILNIAGKSSLYAWKRFCNQFGIERSFIGDRDNVINSQFGPQIEPLKRQIPRQYHGHKLTKSEQYTALIRLISDTYPQLEQQLTQWINRQARNHIYITRHGDLEAYLGLHDKGLDQTINWCINQMSQRLGNPQFVLYRNDLNQILDKIFHVKSD